MKKQLLLFVMMMLPLVAGAESVEIDGIYYNLITKANIAEVTGATNRYSGDVVIPETVTYNDVNYNVTTIREKAFANCSLNSIAIPRSITRICSEAFSYGSVSTVKINDLAAWCNINFESYFYTNPLSKASHLFLNDEEIRDLVIPNGVTTITKNAFYQFSGLTSVKIPSSVTSIGYECFAYCLGIKTVEIGDNTSQEASTVLGGRVFYKCNNVESVVLGNNIVEIGGDAFNDCNALHSIVIPNSVKTMGKAAFAECDNLESVQLSKNLQSIETACFGNCPNLDSLIIIPDGVELLGESAFYSCTNLTEVKLPSNLKKIDWCVFQGCTGLTSIEIPDLTHTINVSAFDGCSNLKTLTLGKSVKDIQYCAFANCPLLEDVYCKADTPPTCHTKNNNGKVMGAFYDSHIEYSTLHVPAESVNAYKASDTWKTFKSIVSIEDGDIPELQKCATPTISYNNGQLTFACSTDGVEYVSEITNSDIKKNFEATVTLTATYNISVYATKVGFERSEVATATLCWIDQQPQTEDGLVEVKAKALLIKNNDGCITVEGADDGERVSVYTLSGVQVGGAVCNSGMAVVNTNLQKGEIVVVKVGERSVKVLMK